MSAALIVIRIRLRWLRFDMRPYQKKGTIGYIEMEKEQLVYDEKTRIDIIDIGCS